MAREDLPILNMSNPKHKRVLKGYIDGLDGLYRFEFTRCRDQRSLRQNAYMHGVVFVEVARGLTHLWGEQVDMLRAKAFLKDQFLRMPEVDRDTGEVRGYVTRDTHTLDVDECRQFIESCIEFASDKLGVSVPSSEEYEQVAAAT